MSPLQKVANAYRGLLRLTPDDWFLPDFLLSLMVGNQMSSFTDPLWCWLIGPAGSGKNEAMRAFRGHPTADFCTAVTENAFMSGFYDEDNPDYDPSYLNELDGKILIFEETSTLLEMSENSINKLLGDMRNLYGDEEQMKRSGSAGQRSYQATFGVLFGGTPAVDSIMSRHQQLGERFVSFRVMRRSAERPLTARLQSLRHVRKAMEDKDQWREELKTTTQTEYDRILTNIKKPDGEHVFIAESTSEQLFQLADFVARLRTVPVMGMPVDPETGNRLIQQFVMFGSARAVCDERDEWSWQDTHFVQRIANDTLPRWVVQLLCILAPAPPAQEGAEFDPRPKVPYKELIYKISAVGAQTLASYIRQYRYLGILTPHSRASSEGGIQLTKEALAQLKYSGLLFGERGKS